MKWLAGALVVGMLSLPLSAHADAFDRARRAVNLNVGRADMSGFSLHGGAALSSGASATSATILRGQGSIGGPCGAFDLATSMAEAFETLPDLFESLIQQLLSQMPMLVLCYASPSLCDLGKHFQNLLSALIQAKYGQCTQIQTAMAYSGLRLRGGAIGHCLEAHAQAGLPIQTAMNTCMKAVDTLRLPDGLNGKQLRVVADTMRAAGASSEMQQLAQSLFGEVTLSADGDTLGVREERPQDTVMQRYEAHRATVTSTLHRAVDEVRTTGQLSAATMTSLAVPGQSLPRVVVDALVAFRTDRVRYDSYVHKLASNLALAQLVWECGELTQQLQGSLEANVHLSEEARAKVQRQILALQRDIELVRAKKRVIEQDLHPAMDAMLQDYVRMQDLATQTGLRAPQAGTPAMPFHLQTPLGYAQ